MVEAFDDDDFSATDEEESHSQGTDDPSADDDDDLFPVKFASENTQLGDMGAKAAGASNSDSVVPNDSFGVPVGSSAFPDQELLLLDGPSAREASLLQLQVDELLNEARFSYDNTAIKATLEKLKKVLQRTPEQQVAPDAAAAFSSSLGLAAKRPLSFKPPESVKACGAFVSGTMALPEATIDISIKMPASCFLRKDYLNHQYHAKRALYLLVMAAALKNSSAFKQQKWEYIQGDPRKPALVVTPKASGQKGHQPFAFRLLPSLSEAAVVMDKLKPSRNCLRSVKATADGEGEPQLLPTPHYNASLLQDILPSSCTTAVRKAMQGLPKFVDTVLLLKVWARHHGLEGHRDDLGGELLAAFAAHTAVARSLSPAMSAVQILKAVLRNLADPRSFKAGIFMERQPGLAAASPPPPLNFKGRFEVTFVEPSGWLNVAAHVSTSALQQAQAAAKRTVALLDDVVSAETAFQAAFLPRHPPSASYDYFWRVIPPAEGPKNLLSADRCIWRVQEETLAKTCRQALNDRIISLRAFGRQPGSTAELSQPELQSGCILLAARVNAGTAMKAADIGPSADQPPAAAFRAFWGGKSELRRFQDGRISEAVAWDVPLSQRHMIIDKIVHYIVQRHLPGTLVTGFAGALDWALAQRRASPDEAVSSMRQLDASLVRLSKQLRSLTSLALKIVAVQPISAAARHTAAVVPQPHPFASSSHDPSEKKVTRCLDPVEVLIQLEGSGRWPDALAAFKKMKAALGVQLAEELFTGFGLRASASEECVDVFTDGFAFRIFLFSERDESLAARFPEFGAEFHHRQRQAVHHGLMTQIAAAHPSYRAAARLAARWMSAHLLSNHVAQEAVELLVGAAYCPGSSLDAPGTSLGGFLSFLRTLAEHPWKERPLIVDPDSSMDAARRQSVVSSFTKARQDGFAPSLPIATAVDQASAHWTAVRPERQVVARTAALAQKALTLLKEAVAKGGLTAESAALAAFDPGLADFSAVVLLRREAIPNADAALRRPSGASGKSSLQTELLLSRAGFPGDDDAEQPVPKAARAVLRTIPHNVVAEWGSEKISKELLVGFSPVRRFVDLLERRFGHLGLFCVDFDGGEIIAIKWRPEAFQPRSLDPEKAHTALPLKLSATVEGEGRPKKKARLSGSLLTVPHTARVLEEIRELGLGLVSDVRLRYAAEP